MNPNKNQNRRDFIISSAKKGILSGFGLFSLTLNAKNKNYIDADKCPANTTCHECYKLGICFESKAVEMKKEIKTNIYTNKVSKGVNHG